MITPDFEGNLQNRLQNLEGLCTPWDDLVMIGSSFGGLMATCFAIKHPAKIQKLILLAPALNFQEFTVPEKQISVPVLLLIGKKDTVTPPNIVIPLARETFANLSIQEMDDDHMLHRTFTSLDWHHLLSDNEGIPDGKGRWGAAE